jgi:hypothetical protein
MSRLKACFDKAKELLGIVGEWYNVRGFRNAITSRLACKTIPLGYMERLYMHYHQAIKCIWNLLCVKCGIAVAEEFKRVALFALFDDMEDYQQKLDEIKEERRMESKDKAPRREAANIILQEVREALAAERAKASNNKDVTSNVLKTNVLKAENAEKRREEMLDLLRNNQNETYETLAAIFGCTSKTISRDIKRLEASGRLRRIGEKSTGHWEVTE